MCVGEMEGWSQTAEGIFNKRKMLFQRETDQNEKKEIVNVEERGVGGGTPHTGTLTSCAGFDNNRLFFRLFNLSQCQRKEKQPPAKMTTQIVEAHLPVDKQRDLVLYLEDGWKSNGQMEQGIGFLQESNTKILTTSS